MVSVMEMCMGQLPSIRTTRKKVIKMKKSKIVSISIVFAALLASSSLALALSASTPEQDEACKTRWFCPSIGKIALLSDGKIVSKSTLLDGEERFVSYLDVPIPGIVIDFADSRNAAIQKYKVEYEALPPSEPISPICAEGWICLDTGLPLILDDGTILDRSIIDDGTRKVVGELDVADVTDPDFKKWVKEQNNLLYEARN